MSASAQTDSGTTHYLVYCLTRVLDADENCTDIEQVTGLPAISTSENTASSSNPTKPTSAALSPDEPQTNSTAVNVPSRTSSQQIAQSSKGAPSQNAPADEAPAARRGSKRSILTRSRNNSRSSRRSARAARAVETKDAVPPVPQNDGTRSEKKSRSGFLSFLNCCSPSETSQEAKEEQPIPAKKTTVPPMQAKASRPVDPVSTTSEKDTESKPLSEKTGQKNPGDEEKIAGVSDIEPKSQQDDQVMDEKQPIKDEAPELAKSQQPYDPSTEPETKAVYADVDRDTDMTDAPPLIPPPHTVVDEPVQPAELQPQVPLPPPPPLSQRQEQVGTIPPVPEASPEKQTWLLPPAQPPLKGRKCLILDLDETLVHSSFKILNQADFTIPVEIEGQYHNVYVIKRPGVDQFMKRVGELYEVVVFTASVSKYGDPLLDQLDIHHVVHHRLFRESCYNHQGNYVKVS